MTAGYPLFDFQRVADTRFCGGGDDGLMSTGARQSGHELFASHHLDRHASWILCSQPFCSRSMWRSQNRASSRRVLFETFNFQQIITTRKPVGTHTPLRIERSPFTLGLAGCPIAQQACVLTSSAASLLARISASYCCSLEQVLLGQLVTLLGTHASLGSCTCGPAAAVVPRHTSRLCMLLGGRAPIM